MDPLNNSSTSLPRTDIAAFIPSQRGVRAFEELQQNSVSYGDAINALIAQGNSLVVAPYLVFTPSLILTAEKVLTQGAGLFFSSGASDFTIALAASGVTAAAYGSASEVPQIAIDQYGRATSAVNVTITPAAIGAVPATRNLTAGAGLTGGGDLSADRTFDIGAGTGITVNANDVALDTASARNVDHSAVSITAGTGLSGGGTIAATRTINLANTAVTPGTYSPVNSITVDAQGRITAIS